MSFFTSFCDLPQKEQERLPVPALMSSRFRSIPNRYRSWDDLTLLSPSLAVVVLVDDDLVDEAVLLGLGGAHVVVALGVAADALDGLAGVLLVELVQLVARAQDFLGVDVDVG